ncbi:hypothetical protein CHGG_07302 [Chaetomium globosum CBS 148.51]|uniref:C2H2-type domain-containing protein n=1 Tax=Chaetomium globosum (strain ATCC 6205 / CBS 148.51 / DSM 1962 / NBRC 6347 / NRRL 1970) TaxID=306901 RepID=Q2GXK2_CHAGB|nr:uncharacterized protein CHGG_07302 [Chaetomium globosum CBS 148.51]EAQ86049.1 hypothetical protein CHGG_07302 [Chaetomium globosum CBS 148.51]
MATLSHFDNEDYNMSYPEPPHYSTTMDLATGTWRQFPEWASAPHGLGVTPSIVDQADYFPGEYSFTPGAIEAFNPPPYDFPVSKAPGFVGELSQVPRSSCLSPRPPNHGGQHARAPRASISPSVSCHSGHSGSTIVPLKSSSSPSSPGLALDTRLARQASMSVSAAVAAATAASSLASTPASSAVTSGLLLTPPTTSAVSSSSSSFSSRSAWSSPPVGCGSPAPRSTPSSRLVSSFFSQSSGHFVPPLESCWFPLVATRNPTARPCFADMIPVRADPSLIHPDVRPMAMPYEPSYPAPPNSGYPTSPALSVSASPQLRPGSTSPFMHNSNYQPYSPFQPPVDPQRRGSLVSYQSNFSGEQPFSGDESREKQRCPHPDCGKAFKDLKAHMLTHQTERPEKCPITTCEYHVKGFARKYDKNRYTLTHYKGTMVCGFCPGSGSAAEKSFNRADVFKRHLTAVHGVEQTPPNSRKKAAGATNGSAKLTGYAPDATGKCSTCSQTFSNAQDFYEHLDDCVLRIVQQEDPAEAINAQRLAEVENDRDVHNTLEKNHLPTTTMTTTEDADEDDENMDEDEYDDELKGGRGGKGSLSSPRRTKGGNPINGVQKSRGLTHSRGGVPLQNPKSRGRKNRRDYPSSWGFDKGQMTMKKRVMAVFDGQRRLAKDDMMLSTEQEVRIKLQDGKSYVTDLDMQTLKRAEGFLGATDEEKGPWISDDPTEEQLKQMLEYPEPPVATAAQ